MYGIRLCERNPKPHWCSSWRYNFYCFRFCGCGGQRDHTQKPESTCAGWHTPAYFERRLWKAEIQQTLWENVAADPDAKALARCYHWTIAPCGDTALNMLGLSTQVTAVWSYISDGPYKNYGWDKTKIEFKHRINKEVTSLSQKELKQRIGLTRWLKKSTKEKNTKSCKNLFCELR